MEDDLDAHYRLADDIDAGGTRTWNDGDGFDPIGEYDPTDGSKGFTGTLDGAGHTIDRLWIMRSSGPIGLIEWSAGGTVRDIGLADPRVSGDGSVAGLVGRNDGTVRNVSMEGSVGRVAGTDRVGGVVGYNTGTVRDVSTGTQVADTDSEGGVVEGTDGVGEVVGYNTGTVRDVSTGGRAMGTDNVGGVVGNNTGTVQDASVVGDETDVLEDIEGVDNTGGVVGYNAGTVRNVSVSGTVDSNSYAGGGLVGYNTGTVTDGSGRGAVDGSRSVGGAVGVNVDTVSNVSATGNVSGLSNVGGLVGENSEDRLLGEGVIRDSRATGAVSGRGTGPAGGLVGENAGVVENASATGNVTGGTSAGGLVGENAGSIDAVSATGTVTAPNEVGGIAGENRGTIENASASGNVSGSDVIGGLVGRNEFFGGTVRRSYATGDVAGDESADRVGGLIGVNGGRISGTYALGTVTGSESVGGLIGSSESENIGPSYWIDTSGSDDATRPVGSGIAAGVETAAAGSAGSYTLSDLRGESARRNMGAAGDDDFDFETTWRTVPGEFPTLRAVDAPTESVTLNGNRTLTVTATNASGAKVSNAEIVLYNGSTRIDNRTTDASGVAALSGLATGEYELELYGPEGGFWGRDSVTVGADGTETTVQRTAPRLADVTLAGDANGEGGFYGGRPVTVSATVENTGPERQVRTRIQIDVDDDGRFERRAIQDPHRIPAPGLIGTPSRTFDHGFDPATNGTKPVRVITEVSIDDNWTTTDIVAPAETVEVEHNIVGYDPDTGTYDNLTTRRTDRTYPSSAPSLPSGVSDDDVSLPGTGEYRQDNVTETSGYPWSAIGSISTAGSSPPSVPPTPHGCTAAVVGNRHILTAGHCVFNFSSQSPEVVFETFKPGREIRLTPQGYQNITYVQMYKKYDEISDSHYDIAVLTLDEPIASQTGTLGYEGNPPISRIYGSGGIFGNRTPAHLTGYPSPEEVDFVAEVGDQHDIIARGAGRGRCPEPRLCHGYETGPEFDTFTARGLSGSPVWQERKSSLPTIISVHSGEELAGRGDLLTVGVGARISEKKYDDIGQMIDHGYAQVPADNPNPLPETPRPPDDGKSGSATGDPHLTTYDGVAYDFQAAGEFVLTNATDGSPQVQVRLRPVAGRDVSVISAVATEINGTEITIDARDRRTLTVDGTARSLEAGESLPVEDGEIHRTTDRYVVVYPGENNEVDDGDSRLEVTVVGNRLDVVVKPNRSAVGSMRGLLGSPDGNASNDIALADGTTLSTSPSFEALYGEYREEYRVTAADSLFDYDDGESAAAFYDADYPSERVTVDDLPDDDRREAIDAALDAGLEPGTAPFRDAVIDYALTGDRSYVESASRATRQSEITVDATPSETPLMAPNLTVDADQSAAEERPLTVSVTAGHPAPDDATVVISNGTDVVFQQDVTGAFESERTVSWDTTVDGDPVDDGVYTLGVVATSESGVRNVTTRGVIVDNTAPTVTLETTDTDLDATVDTATITFGYDDTVSGVDPGSVTVLDEGADVTGSARISASNASYELTGLEPGETRTVGVRVADEAGQMANRTVTVSVAAADGSDGPGGGGGGGGLAGAAADDVPLIDVDPAVVEEADIGQRTAEFRETETVSRITFDETTLGSVTVSEFDALPDSTVETVAERIAGDVTTIDSTSRIDVVTVVDISPNSVGSDRPSATIELELPSERLDDPENAVILHRTADGWKTEETTVQAVSDGTVTLTAPVDSFSLFAVVERSPARVTTPTLAPTQATADGTPESDSEPTPADRTRTPEPAGAVETPKPTSTIVEPGGFSTPILVVTLALLGGIITAVAILRRRDML